MRQRRPQRASDVNAFAEMVPEASPWPFRRRKSVTSLTGTNQNPSVPGPIDQGKLWTCPSNLGENNPSLSANMSQPEVRHYMSPIPSKPSDSVIREISGFDVCTYRWELPNVGYFRYLVSLFLIFILSGFAFGWIRKFAELNWNEQIDELHIFRMVFLSGSALVWLFWIFVLYLLLRPPRPEVVRLTATRFQYDPGRLPFAYPHLIYDSPWVQLADPLRYRRKRVDILKSELETLTLDHFGGRQRLYFHSGPDRVEIGEHLRDPDREWLAATINAWKAK